MWRHVVHDARLPLVDSEYCIFPPADADLNKSKQAPPLVFGGFAFLLAFVFATIPAGIYGEEASSLPGQARMVAWLL